MALTLPNTLSFTAGNPLTAVEMNKMWANDKFLADNINDGKLVIKVNGTIVDNSFNANSASDVEVDIDVPENVSDLNDAGDYAKLANIPTKTSDLTNDGEDGTSPFLTAADVPGAANNGKLTLKVNGVEQGNFTANQANDTDIDLDVPTEMADLVDGANYSTTSQMNTALTNAISGIAAAKLSYDIVTALPTSDIDLSTVYMILDETDPSNPFYDQWMYINSDWKHLGSTKMDLSNYVTFDDLPTMPTVSNAAITLKSSNGNTIDSFTLNQTNAQTITLPEGGSSKTITIADADNTTIDSFALNSTTDKTIKIPAATDSKYGLTKVEVSTIDLTEGSALDQGKIYGVKGAPTSGLVDLIYPVGSIYMSANSTNPSVLFGGSWTQIKDTNMPVYVWKRTA